MKVRQRIRPIDLGKRLNPLNIKEGRVTLELIDEKTGLSKKVYDHNMTTNAISKMLVNCGWLNDDNLPQNDLVESLLGGVVLVDQSIPENANNIFVPSGHSMTANGAVGIVNGGDPEELGSWDEIESGSTERGRGWQADGSWVEVFTWNGSHGNGNIGCICATNKEAGFCGLGNKFDNQYGTVGQLTLTGTPTQYKIPGVPCKVDLTDSSCYAVDFDTENDKIIIRKIRLPFSKVNLTGAPTIPVVLSTREVTMPAGIKTLMGYITDYDWYNGALSYGRIQDTGETLNIIDVGLSAAWGDGYTPTLWEIDPTDGSITTSTLTNTSGDTLHTICQPVWLGRNKLAWIDGEWSSNDRRPMNIDGRTIYSMERISGTWDPIQKCANPAGSYQSYYPQECGWVTPYSIQDYAAQGKGRLLMMDSNGDITSFDFATNTCYLTNSRQYNYTNAYTRPTSSPLIGYQFYTNNDGPCIQVIRTQMAINTIFNLENVVTKTSSMTMKLTYRFEFAES